MKGLHMAAVILLLVGGLNWLLVGLFSWNLVHFILGSMNVLENLVYILVGISALYLLFSHKAECLVCVKPKGKR